MKLTIEYEIPEDYEDVHPDIIVDDFRLNKDLVVLSVKRDPEWVGDAGSKEATK